MHDSLTAFLCQGQREIVPMDRAVAELSALIGNAG